MRQLLLCLLIVSGLGYFVARGGNFGPAAPAGPKLLYGSERSEGILERCGAPTQDRVPVLLSMTYSPELGPWLKEATVSFGRLCPNIQVRLKAQDDLSAAQAIAEEKQAPTLWATSSDTALRLADHLYRQRKAGRPLYAADQRTALLATPMVWVMPAPVLRALKAIAAPAPLPRGARAGQAALAIQADRPSRGSQGAWLDAACALVPREASASQEVSPADLQPGRWVDWYTTSRRAVKKPRVVDPLLEELARWGNVKFGQPHPASSALGLEVMYLQAAEFLLDAPERAAADPAVFTRALKQQRGALQDLLQRCKSGVPELSSYNLWLVNGFFSMGVTRYELIVATEQFAVEYMTTKPGADELRVVYPATALWSDHPVVELHVGDLKEADARARHDAAGRWVQYLLSDAVQRSGIELGFRPRRPGLSITDHKVGQNPFLRLVGRGVELERTRREPPPVPVEAMAELTKLWSEATGHY